MVGLRRKINRCDFAQGSSHHEENNRPISWQHTFINLNTTLQRRTLIFYDLLYAKGVGGGNGNYSKINQLLDGKTIKINVKRKPTTTTFYLTICFESYATHI